MSPVTNFVVHEVAAEQVYKKVFKRYMVRLRSRGIYDHPLRVDQLGDLNLAE